MLDRQVVKEFLEEKFEDAGIKIPKGISKKSLVETFCQYVEDDYYDWLTDNLKSFSNHYHPDWAWIKGRIDHYSE